MSFVMHPTVDDLLRTLRGATPHAILFSGADGVGLRRIAEELAGDTTPRFINADESKATPVITVEIIRKLYEQTRGKQATDQFFIIHRADSMTKSAQSAFLKLLEEPNESVHFILTTSTLDKLLPTILSRVQRFNVPPITTEQSAEYIASLGVKDAVKTKQLLYIADGLPEEIEKLATDEEYFQQRTMLIKDARVLLMGEVYDQLLVAHRYKEDRSQARQLVVEAIRLARRSLSDSHDKRLVERLEKLLEVQAGIERNGNIRLQLAHFVV
jgi:DNA polymerase III delta prime subunit